MMLPRLLLFTDRRQLPPGHDLVEVVRDCAAAGLSTVIVRELDLDETQRAGLVAALRPHLDVVSAHTAIRGASGVHLAAHQPGWRGRHGRSCHDAEQLRLAACDGADWVTLSPVAASESKPGYGPVLGSKGVAALVPAAGAVPVYALGGVGPDNAAALRSAGAHGVAVMGAVMRAEDPAGVVAALVGEVG